MKPLVRCQLLNLVIHTSQAQKERGKKKRSTEANTATKQPKRKKVPTTDVPSPAEYEELVWYRKEYLKLHRHNPQKFKLYESKDLLQLGQSEMDARAAEMWNGGPST